MIADTVNSWANGFLIVSLVVGVVSTFAIVVSGKFIQNELRRGISQANADAEEAKKDAAIANQKTAILEKETAFARLETETLKKQFAWRRLNERQFRIISEGLSKVDIKTEVVLSAITSDPESMTFAGDIKLAMVNGGLKVSLRPSVFFGQRPFVGIEISGSNKEDLEKIAQPFVNAGLNPNGIIKEKQKYINILIGSKPPPVVNN